VEAQHRPEFIQAAKLEFLISIAVFLSEVFDNISHFICSQFDLN
jgi:hypothetical protein